MASPGPSAASDQANLAAHVPGQIVNSSEPLAWKEVLLERRACPASEFSIPPLGELCLAVHTAGPTLIGQRVGSGPLERGWVETGDLTVTPPGEKSAWIVNGPVTVLILQIAPSLVHEVIFSVYDRDPAGISFMPRFAAVDKVLSSYAMLLSSEVESGGDGSRLLADGISRALLVHLLRRHSSLSAPRLEPLPRIAVQRLRTVVDYIEVHLDKPITLATLAKLAGLSQSHFSRGFKNSTGESPYKFVTRRRLERARKLLEMTTMPIIDVALHCGFESPTHFTTVFTKSTGMNPRQWRALRRT